MALRGLLLTLLRGWYLVVAALLCAALLVVHFAQDQVVYTTRTSITFTYPNASELEPYNGTGDKSVISFVSAVVEKVNGGVTASTYADDSAPYYGAGIRRGVNVTLPNDGGQFVAIYRMAQIDIEIVGPSADWVKSKQTGIIADVFRISEDMQAAAGVRFADRIIPTVVPLSLLITSVAPSRSSLILAVAGLGAAGLLVGGWGAVTVERLRSRARGARGRAAPDSNSTTA